MKRLLIAALLSVLAGPALAVCPTTLQVKDNAAVTANAVYQDSGAGNCMPTLVLGAAGSTNTVAVTTAGADGVSNTLSGLQGYVRNSWYNGTTWDRSMGDTTNGGWVNVKTSVLPTGAATAAKQPALGTAGSASTDVLSVQGIASMTPFLVNPGTAANWGVGTSTQNSASVANGHLMLGQFNTTPTTLSTGNMSPLQMDSAGNALVNCKTGCATVADATQSFSITSTTTSTALALVGTQSAQFNLTSIGVGTIVGQISNDNSNWVSVPLLNMGTAISSSNNPFIAAATGATATGNYLLIGSQGARFARVSVTFTSGTFAGNVTATSQAPAASLGDFYISSLMASATPTGTNTIGNVNGAPNITPTDCSGTISTGGTAQNAFTAGATKHGFTVMNLSTDPMWVSFTTTAAVGATQSYLLAAGSSTVTGGSFTTPVGFGMNTALSVIAATTSDKFSCTWW